MGRLPGDVACRRAENSITFDPRNVFDVLNQCPFLGEERRQLLALRVSRFDPDRSWR
jgi:hypothetical protein